MSQSQLLETQRPTRALKTILGGELPFNNLPGLFGLLVLVFCVAVTSDNNFKLSQAARENLYTWVCRLKSHEAEAEDMRCKRKINNYQGEKLW